MSAKLRVSLSLVIGHKTTDALWGFNRDGMIRWLHGMRFLTPPPGDAERVRAIAGICNAGADVHSRMGFPPLGIRPPEAGLLPASGEGGDGTIDDEVRIPKHDVRRTNFCGKSWGDASATCSDW